MMSLTKSSMYSTAPSLCSTTLKIPAKMKIHYQKAICSPFSVNR